MFRPIWARRVWVAAVAGVLTAACCSFYEMWWYEDDLGEAKAPQSCNFWGMFAPPTYTATGPAPRRYGWQNGAVTTTVQVHLAMIAGALLGGVRLKKRPAEREADEQPEV